MKSIKWMSIKVMSNHFEKGIRQKVPPNSMGVFEALKFLKSKDVTFNTIKDGRQLILQSRENVLVDVLGSFFIHFVKSEPSVIAHRLYNTFSGLPNVMLVFDGERTDEKLHTSEIRARKLEKQMLLVEDKAAAVLNKTSKSMRPYKSARKKVLFIQPGVIDKVMELLMERGICCVKAKGEADVYIASQKQPFLAISGDSDLLFHKSTSRVLFYPKLCRLENSFRGQLVDKSDALKKLKLSPNQLVALAITSPNDYNSDQEISSIESAYDIIRKNSSTSDTIRAIVSKFQGRCIKPVSLEAAISIFDDLKESLSKDSRDPDVLERYQKLSSVNSNIRQRLKVCSDNISSFIGAKEKPEKDVSKWRVSRNSKPNRFRPLQMLSENERYSFKEMRLKPPSPNAFHDGVIKKVLPKNASKSEKKREERRIRAVETELAKDAIKREKKRNRSAQEDTSKKKKAKKAQTAAFSASSRGPVSSGSSSDPRTRSDDNRLYHNLTRQYAMKTWKIGTIDSRIKDSTLLEDPPIHEVKQAIQWLVEFMHDVKDRAGRLTHCFLLLLIKLDLMLDIQGGKREKLDISSFTDQWVRSQPQDSSSTEDEKRKVFGQRVISMLKSFSLDHILSRLTRGLKKNVAGKDYWQRVCHLVAKGKLSSVKNKVPFLLMLEEHPDLDLFLIKSSLNVSVTKATNNIGQVLDTAFAGQVIGRLPELINRVLHHNSGLEEQVSQILEKYPNEILAFYHINCLLPEHMRFSLVPESPIKHNYVTIAEETILEACPKGIRERLFPVWAFLLY